MGSPCPAIKVLIGGSKLAHIAFMVPLSNEAAFASSIDCG